MIVAYPTKWTPKLPALPSATTDTSGVQQVVINIGDNNFGKIFPKEQVEFIDRLKMHISTLLATTTAILTIVLTGRGTDLLLQCVWMRAAGSDPIVVRIRNVSSVQ